ncbi:EamA family transporter [Caldithrix abyssi]|nr:EamA family transporter [Caldithrix abyssi]
MFKLKLHLRAVLQAVFVTFLWSTSWVLIKIGLNDIPALTFAGLRYGLAFLCLLPFFLHKRNKSILFSLSWHTWRNLVLLGFLFYAVTQGAQFLGLVYLPSVTVSLLLNFTTIIVAFLGVYLLNEKPNFQQWVGIILFLIGVIIYFYPAFVQTVQIFGVVIVLVGVLANALSSILGRHVNRNETTPPIIITTVSMGIGAALLLSAGIIVEGLPSLNLQNWLIVIWLAIVNTAFAFTLWNHTLRTLSAVESSILNNTMLIQIAILAWIFLDEPLTAQEIIGIILGAGGVLMVQLKNRIKSEKL